MDGVNGVNTVFFGYRVSRSASGGQDSDGGD